MNVKQTESRSRGPGLCGPGRPVRRAGTFPECAVGPRAGAGGGTGRSGGAFTLVELLVVISIIGLLAGMLVGLAPAAMAKMRDARVRVELNQLVAAIEEYKSK